MNQSFKYIISLKSSKGDGMKKIMSILCLFLTLLFLASCQSRVVDNGVTGGVVIGTSGIIYGPTDYGTEKQERQGAGWITVKEFHLIADRRFGYKPNVLEVNKGDTLRIIMYVPGSAMDKETVGFVLPTFGINEAGQGKMYKTIEFVADQAGTFTFFNNIYNGPATQDMDGKLIVVDSEE